MLIGASPLRRGILPIHSNTRGQSYFMLPTKKLRELPVEHRTRRRRLPSEHSEATVSLPTPTALTLFATGLLALLWQAKRRGNRIALAPSPVLRAGDRGGGKPQLKIAPQLGGPGGPKPATFDLDRALNVFYEDASNRIH
jgi:hypothetical protein